MTLYWYVHWFWITTCCSCCYFCHATVNESLTMTTVTEPTTIPTVASSSDSLSHLTTIDVSHRSPKSIGDTFPSVAPSIASRLKALKEVNDRLISNATAAVDNSTASLKQSVIEQATGSSENLTFVNTTAMDQFANGSSEAMTTLDRITTSAANLSVEAATGGQLSAAGIAGITLGCVSLMGIISVISFVLYRNRGLNRPQVLSDHCSNLDSSGYIDDTSVRDNSEEMYSLDNDSFLNSLEAMTIQNYWTDTVKHTKL